MEQRFFLADHNLIYTDDLVDFATRVPVTYKQRGPVGKWVLKKPMEPYLPHIAFIACGVRRS